MNTYKKFCPNVFVALCEEPHQKGDVIELTTKYQKTHECEVHNFLGYLGTKEEPKFLYSITRTDGFNAQERAKNKAEKLKGYQANAETRSTEAWKKSDMSEANTGIPFGQPILVGHHSEGAHRRLIERSHRAMDKCVEEGKKAEEYQARADYWERQANVINLSMPESLEYYEFKLEEAKKHHELLKKDPSKRKHGYSLTYAKKEVNNNKKNLDIAVKLWGSPDEVQQINKEKEEAAVVKSAKDKKSDDLVKKYGGFFFFGSDKEAFKIKYNALKESGHVEDGDKVQHVFAGLYMPVKNVDAFLKESK
tara:strand:- start:29348 stop:30268 length:921 start_codon:yes stop_codon:yes gene_type:complete